MKLIPKCLNNSGNALGTMGKTITELIKLLPSIYNYFDKNGKDVQGYWYTGKDGNLYLTGQDNNTGQWRGIGTDESGNTRIHGEVNFIPEQTIGDENQELTVRPNGADWEPRWDYRSARSDQDVIDGFNTLTFGGLNNLSPTQWARRVYDLKHVLYGDMSVGNYALRWVNGNEGIVSRLFNLDHPYWSMAINGVADMASGYGSYKGLKLLKSPKRIGTNLGEEVAQISDLAGNYSMNSNKFAEVFNNSKLRISDFYGSKNYADRAKIAGLTDEELANTIKLENLALSRTLGSLVDAIDSSTTNAKSVKGGEVKGSTRSPYLAQDSSGKWEWKNGIIRMIKDKWKSLDDFILSVDHEGLHTSTLSSNGEGSGVKGITSKGENVIVNAGTSLLDRNLEYDKILQSKNVNPAYLSKETFTAAVKKQHPEATSEQIENGWKLAKYTLEPTEWRSRALALQLEANRLGKTLLEYLRTNPLSNINYSLMRKYATPQQIYNYASRALGVTAPIGFGYKLLKEY